MADTNRRAQLLAAAREVFASKGYHDAKVDDIVAAADVAKGTFYLYFKDKRSVFSELVDDVFARLTSAILRVDINADIESQIRHNIRAVLHVLLDEPELTRILLTSAQSVDPAFQKKIRSFYGDVRFLMEKALADGQKMDVVAPGDPKLLTLFTIGAIKEVVLELALEKSRAPREQLVDAVFSILQNGYLRVKTPKSPARRAH